MHTLFNICFRGCSDKLFVEFSLGGVQAHHRNWIMLRNLPKFTIENKEDVFFGPALRKTSGIMGKENVACSHVVWIDYDELYDTMPPSLIPPSAIVKSGRGAHLYWRLQQPIKDIEQLEKVNIALASCMGGDSAHNIDRLLRVPNTINTKYETNKDVKIVHSCDFEYSVHELLLLSSIPDKLRTKIITGSTRGFRSRSERDWHIVRKLVGHGLHEDSITRLFREHECGNKYLETNNDHYLPFTIKKAAEQTQQEAAFLIQQRDGYYTKQRNGLRRVSTFVLHPTLLLNGEEQDHILCDVTADGMTERWKNVTIPQSALVGVRVFSKYLNKAPWSWLGSDSDVRLLRAHLISNLQEQGMPTAKTTSVLGYHKLSNKNYFVGTNFVIDNEGNYWNEEHTAPIVYTPPKQEVPQIVITNPTKPPLTEIAGTLHKINTASTIWPMIGWFMASPLKPAIEKLSYRFPILNIFGTRGSGKSTTILRVFLPMLGYKEERAYDSNTTQFVILSLLASSNSVPISFSEFRVSSTNNFMRYVLLSYDSGRDPRGQRDQSTVDYQLTAPFVIDGEDMLDDSAAMERIIAVHLNPHSIIENSDHWKMFQQIQELNLNSYTLLYLKHILQIKLDELLVTAKADVEAAFTMSLPPRIRKNLIVCWLGILMYTSFMQAQGIHVDCEEGANVLQQSLELVYNTSLGRGHIAADDFIETIVNAAAGGLRTFPWHIEESNFWFQLTPAFNFFMSQKARVRQNTLSRQAIRAQLIELTNDYTLKPETRVLRGKNVLAYGVNLTHAHASGLDVPASITQRKTPTVTLKQK